MEQSLVKLINANCVDLEGSCQQGQ